MSLIMELKIPELVRLTELQLKNLFAYNGSVEEYVENTLIRCEKCFSHYHNQYYNAGNGTRFNPYHTGQYSIYLYYLSNEAGRAGDKECAALLYCLNKALHAVDWYYEIALPEWWYVEHPVGSVLGRAQYGNGLVVYQGCTVGESQRNGKLLLPVIGEGVTMYTNSSILGACHIGNNVVIGAGAIVKNQDVPSDSMVFGQSPNLIIKILGV